MPRARSQRSGPVSSGPRIAVVGAGLSGAALALALLRGGACFASLVLIDRSDGWGRGLAYSTNCDAHLLNSRTALMGIGGDREDFVYWLAERGAEDGPFAKRRDYGDYLEERLTRAIESSSADVRCVVRDAAVSLEQSRSRTRVRLASGDVIEADIVVLATGNQKPALPALFADADIDDRLIGNPWDFAALDEVATDEDVLLLGAGMTMIDVTQALAQRERTGRIFALSRRGLLPQTHTPNLRSRMPRTLPPRLSEALHEMRWQARVAETQGRSWRDVLDELRASSPEIWRRLPLDAKRRFLRHVRPWWDIHRHKLAPSIAARIDRLRTSGALEVLAGAVTAVAAADCGAEVRYRPRGQTTNRTLSVSRIINCTGPNLDVRTADDPLLRQILEDGYARPHDTGLGLDVTEDGALIDVRGAPSRHLFALGALTQGAFWEITAAPEIRARATALAQLLSRRSGAVRETLSDASAIPPP